MGVRCRLRASSSSSSSCTYTALRGGAECTACGLVAEAVLRLPCRGETFSEERRAAEEGRGGEGSLSPRRSDMSGLNSVSRDRVPVGTFATCFAGARAAREVVAAAAADVAGRAAEVEVEVACDLLEGRG